MAKHETSRGSPTPNHFLLFVQKKLIKENHTLLPLNPSVLAPHLRGDCGTRSAHKTVKVFPNLAKR
jgi:hypothetical protein